MKRSEVLKWLQSHGGQVDMQTEYKTVDNPNRKSSKDPEKIRQKYVTWTAKDGQRLTVIDTTEDVPQPDSFYPTPETPGAVHYDPSYDLVNEGKEVKEATPDKTPASTAFQEAKRAQEQKESEANYRDHEIYETDAEKRARLLQEKNEKDQDRDYNRRTEIDARTADIQGRQVSVSESAEARAAKKDERDATKPEFLSRADPDSKNIAMFDPVSGQVRTVANPNYDEAKVEAQRKKDELTLAIQLRKMSSEEATAEYSRWFKQNVEVPFMQAAEARSRAQEQRAALDAEERRRQFASDFSLRKASLGEEAGQHAAQNEIALLPYRAGPAEASQMSSAINSLAQGGSLDKDASAGINFTADAFQFDRPDFEGIAKKATEQALGHLTNYRPSSQGYSTADYSGINTNVDMSQAPSTAPTGGPDLMSMYNELVSKYTPAR